MELYKDTKDDVREAHIKAGHFIPKFKLALEEIEAYQKDGSLPVGWSFEATVTGRKKKRTQQADVPLSDSDGTSTPRRSGKGKAVRTPSRKGDASGVTVKVPRARSPSMLCCRSVGVVCAVLNRRIERRLRSAARVCCRC